MHILGIAGIENSKLNYLKSQKDDNAKNTNNVTTPIRDSLSDYPKNFRPNFGVRIERTPLDFFEFNKKRLPHMVKKLLFADQSNFSKHPLLVQQEAYKYLDTANSVYKVKDVYPDEPLFSDLIEVQDTQGRGYLAFVRKRIKELYPEIDKPQNISILKSGENLTVYLLKKIFLEAKTVEEINFDFNNDVKEEFDSNHFFAYLLDSNQDKSGNTNDYFLDTTITALGIKRYNKAYFNSLRGTIEEYYKHKPRHRRGNSTNKPETEPNIKSKNTNNEQVTEDNPDEIKALEDIINSLIGNNATELPETEIKDAISEPDEAESLDEKSSPDNKLNQSIFLQYESPIMTIAADKVKLSDKMVEFFKDKAEQWGIQRNRLYNIDYAHLSQRMKRLMKYFWKRNENLREEYSDAIMSTIEEFEKNKNNDIAISELCKTADKIKEANKKKAEARRKEVAESRPEIIPDEIIKNMLMMGFYMPSVKKIYPSCLYNAYQRFLNNFFDQSPELMEHTRKKYPEIIKGEEVLEAQGIMQVFDIFKKQNKKMINGINMAVVRTVTNSNNSLLPVDEFVHLTEKASGLRAEDDVDAFMKNLKEHQASYIKNNPSIQIKHQATCKLLENYINNNFYRILLYTLAENPNITNNASYKNDLESKTQQYTAELTKEEKNQFITIMQNRWKQTAEHGFLSIHSDKTDGNEDFIIKNSKISNKIAKDNNNLYREELEQFLDENVGFIRFYNEIRNPLIKFNIEESLLHVFCGRLRNRKQN